MGRQFETTRWSLILEAGGSAPSARQAMEWLCQAYWYPLYAFIRRQGHGPEAAQDLTQAYFANLLETGYLERADPEAGKFRSFLLVSLKHFLSNERSRERALKRRADDPAFRVALESAEDRFLRDPRTEDDAEALYDRRWALTTMSRAFERLESEYASNDQSAVYAGIRGFLTGSDATMPYARVAQALGMSEGAVKVAVHRMRRRLGLMLRDEVAQTVGRPEDVDDELRYLLRIIES